ncbi:hypothetical protein CY34DRAFT_604239 [Suillus luteus UH-Slu-Lm8-n1]|uniref:Uncharacterized protein n=1 Tax=Suillus luteus UH-Slu-Lm8-n1 TaxID=930992 RepID=A0A0D0ALA7_9AGAM|nr:hypothetical protein CY34DRAFT_604239 [Suillus luteus UH-Slu-Lm8-n1]
MLAVGSRGLRKGWSRRVFRALSHRCTSRRRHSFLIAVLKQQKASIFGERSSVHWPVPLSSSYRSKQLEGSMQDMLKLLPSDPFVRPIRTRELRPLLYKTKAAGHRLGNLEVASLSQRHVPERKVPDIERPNPNSAGNKRTLPIHMWSALCSKASRIFFTLYLPHFI